MITEKQAPSDSELLRICRGCTTEKHPDEFYIKNNYCKTCMKNKAAEWAKENPEKSALRYRKAWLRRYNMTLADYDNLLALQGGGCAICSTTRPGGTGRFHIDHDHACCPERMRSCGRCVRGLLCSYCNLHLAGENPRRLRQAADYIEKFRSEREGEGKATLSLSSAERGNVADLKSLQDS